MSTAPQSDRREEREMNTDTMDLDTMAEVLCNLRGLDPNDDDAFEAIRAEIVRDKVTFEAV